MRLLAYVCTLFLFVFNLNAHEGHAPSTVVATSHPKLGKILTDTRGMTLYTFAADKDSQTSTCYDECSKAWPPYVITGKPSLPKDLTGTIDTVDRKDNKAQVTYNGMPLYYYIKDKKPGDARGQNVDKKWFVVNPSK